MTAESLRIGCCMGGSAGIATMALERMDLSSGWGTVSIVSSDFEDPSRSVVSHDEFAMLVLCADRRRSIRVRRNGSR